MPRPCAYAGRDCAEGGGVHLYGIQEREKQADDLREVPRTAVQGTGTAKFGAGGILCRYSRKEWEENRGVHLASAG